MPRVGEEVREGSDAYGETTSQEEQLGCVCSVKLVLDLDQAR